MRTHTHEEDTCTYRCWLRRGGSTPKHNTDMRRPFTGTDRVSAELFHCVSVVGALQKDRLRCMQFQRQQATELNPSRPLGYPLPIPYRYTTTM